MTAYKVSMPLKKTRGYKFFWKYDFYKFKIIYTVKKTFLYSFAFRGSLLFCPLWKLKLWEKFVPLIGLGYYIRDDNRLWRVSLNTIFILELKLFCIFIFIYNEYGFFFSHFHLYRVMDIYSYLSLHCFNY